MLRLILPVTLLVLISAACAAEIAETTTTPSVAPVIESSTTVVSPTSEVNVPAGPTTTESTEPPQTTTTTTVPGVTALEVVVVVGEVVEVRAKVDDDVRLTIHSEQVNEVHLHTYDLHADVGPDTPAVIEFVASIPGIFEIEFEQGGTLIAELRVDP